MMKKRVNLSGWSVALTIVSLVVLLCALCWARDKAALSMTASAILILCAMALFYMPVAVSVTDGKLNVHRPLRIKSIPLNHIASIELCPPSMSERRLCGSGGWFGYYGWFREPSIGKYFAYYGKASDCFLVTLRDGHKYMLGCENPDEMVDFVKNFIYRL